MPFLDDLVKELEEEDRQKALAEGLTDEEWRARRQGDIEQQKARFAQIDIQLEQEERERAEEHELGRRLGLGVPVRPAYTIRLDGLSANSRNTGSTIASVTHLYVLGHFERGRLKREPYEFLCNARLRPFDVGYKPIKTEITCPRCRKITGLDPYQRQYVAQNLT